jgi:DNA-binding MarR family transcriptional regulator
MPPRPHHHANRDQAAESLGRVAPLISRWVERLVAGHDPPLTLAEFLALEAVAEGELVGSELARQTAVSPAAVSQVLASLEDMGLLDRPRATADRRRQPLTLSEVGERTLLSTRALLRDRLGSLLAGLPPPEIDALARLLQTLAVELTGRTPPPRPPRPHPPRPEHGPPHQRS